MEWPPKQESEASVKTFILKERDAYKEAATELQKKVAEIQSAKYETSIYKLMRRSGDNTELVNSMNEFLDILYYQASFGDPEKSLGGTRIKDLG